MDGLNIEEYVSAMCQERLVRDASFLSLNSTICGFEVCQITLRHHIVLRLSNSPFLPPFRPPENPVEIATFLWFLNPGWSPDDKLRKRFLKRCRVFTKETENSVVLSVRIVVAIRSFMDETLQDRPGRTVNNGLGRPDYYSDACAVCSTLARAYGWSEEAILKMPLKRIFQYLNEITESDYAQNGKQAPLFNPSDRILGDCLNRVNKKTEN